MADKSYRIVIIGTGNVAFVLGDRLWTAGHRLIQVWGREEATLNALAERWDCIAVRHWEHLDSTADIFVFALSDKALHDLPVLSFLKGKLLVHTAGSVSINVLARISERTGVLYPLQSLKKNLTQSETKIPLLVDAVYSDDLLLLKNVAHSISSSVQQANDLQRMQLHLAAVVVNNFTNYLYHLANKYCLEQGLSFDQLQPLIEETANRLRHHAPAETQTGPAIRQDTDTMAAHLQLLKGHTDLHDLYEWISRKIMATQFS